MDAGAAAAWALDPHAMTLSPWLPPCLPTGPLPSPQLCLRLLLLLLLLQTTARSWLLPLPRPGWASLQSSGSRVGQRGNCAYVMSRHTGRMWRQNRRPGALAA